MRIKRGSAVFGAPSVFGATGRLASWLPYVGYAKSLKSLSFSGVDQNLLVLTKKKLTKIITIILAIL